MTANVLAHSRLFRAGFAESGAYNRTLTPFGFQSERRAFWEVPQVYQNMSPFFYADKIKDPILLMHGEADDNSGTFPIQSERLYMALKGHGATVRYVTLPAEAHGYAASETARRAGRANQLVRQICEECAAADGRGTIDIIVPPTNTGGSDEAIARAVSSFALLDRHRAGRAPGARE